MTAGRETYTHRLTPAFLAREDGTSLVELAIVIPLFLLLFLGLIDFGRLGYTVVMTNAAVDIAARIAVVRPPVCAGVPTVNTRGPVAPNTTPPPYGTSCSYGTNICADPGPISCSGNDANVSPTAAEVWADVAPLMPFGATLGNLTFTYSYDDKLGFLGGPYVPVVSVKLQGASFHFVSPLGGLAQLAGASGSWYSARLALPPIAASLPGEDLAEGAGG